MKKRKINKAEKLFKYFCLVLALICFAICIYRACTTSITYDESFTYMTYVFHNPIRVFRFLIYRGACANNHIMNSFLISVSQLIIRKNYSEIVIRIPSIIFYIVYFVYSYKLAKKYKAKYLYFGFLTLNYGVNEFFGLARGYGMCISLVLAGLYYLKEYFDSKKDGYIILGFLLLILSTYANTISLLIVAPFMIILFLDLIKKKNLFKFIKNYYKYVIPLGIILLIAIRYHFIVSADGLPLYGGDTGFFKDVIENIFYYYGFVKSTESITYFVLGFLLSLIIMNIKIIKNYFVSAMFIHFAIMIIMVKMLNTLWLTGRTLLPTFILISIALFEIIEYYLKENRWLKYIQIIGIAGLGILFNSNVNLKQTRDWNDQYIIKKISYEAYKNKNNESVIPIEENMVTRFYREKILIEKNYDIYAE